MLGGFIGSSDNQGTDWGETLLNTVASNTLRHLFTRSEAVEVAVRCQPSSKLLQGSIDSFKMSGRGLVIRRDFRTEEMSFETDAVSLDFGSVLKGTIALRQPTQAIAQIKLLESDINQAFTATLVRKRLENLTEPTLLALSDGRPLSFTNIRLELLPHNRVKIFAQAHFGDRQVPVSLSCTLSVEKRKRIRFQEIHFEPEAVPVESRDLSEKLTLALGEILNNMVDLDRFDLDGVNMRLNRLETQGKQLLFSGYAKIDRVPKV